jgi:sugar (pentulose or hexulose) kinase
VNVVAPPAHDTAAAVAGVPTANTGRPNWAYISSGTWSLMGVEVKQAVLSPRAQALNVTNEGGVDGTYRLLKNIMGLWLVQQCKRSFDARPAARTSRTRSHSYAELARLAARAKPLRSLVDPDDRRFLNPPDMPAAMQRFCRETRQPVPRTVGELVRCAYESLALKYREVLGWLEELTGEPIEVIHIVGGGSQNAVLNQFTADACQRPVLAGPVEATAMGNLLTQVRAHGELASLAELRAVIRQSSAVTCFEPGPRRPWQDAATASPNAHPDANKKPGTYAFSRVPVTVTLTVSGTCTCWYSLKGYGLPVLDWVAMRRRRARCPAKSGARGCSRAPACPCGRCLKTSKAVRRSSSSSNGFRASTASRSWRCSSLRNHR